MSLRNVITVRVFHIQTNGSKVIRICDQICFINGIVTVGFRSKGEVGIGILRHIHRHRHILRQYLGGHTGDRNAGRAAIGQGYCNGCSTLSHDGVAHGSIIICFRFDFGNLNNGFVRRFHIRSFMSIPGRFFTIQSMVCANLAGGRRIVDMKSRRLNGFDKVKGEGSICTGCIFRRNQILFSRFQRIGLCTVIASKRLRPVADFFGVTAFQLPANVFSVSLIEGVQTSLFHSYDVRNRFAPKDADRLGLAYCEGFIGFGATANVTFRHQLHSIVHHAGTGVVAGSQPNSLPFFTGEGQSISLAQSCHPQILAVFGEGFPPGVCILQANQHVITCSGSCENISPGFQISQITADCFVQLNIGNRMHSDTAPSFQTVRVGGNQHCSTGSAAGAETCMLLIIVRVIKPNNFFVAGMPDDASRNGIKGCKLPVQAQGSVALNIYFTAGQNNGLRGNALDNPNGRSDILMAGCGYLVSLTGIHQAANCGILSIEVVAFCILYGHNHSSRLRSVPQLGLVNGIVAGGFRSERKVGTIIGTQIHSLRLFLSQHSGTNNIDQYAGSSAIGKGEGNR